MLKKAIILAIFLYTFTQRVDAQRIFVPLLGGGVAEVGMNNPGAGPNGAPIPCLPMQPLGPLQGGLYGTPSNPGPIAPMAPMTPMQPMTPGRGYGFTFQ
jgi:hypothetical protein